MALVLDNWFSVSKIVDDLSKASGSLPEENWYVFDYTDVVTRAIAETLDADLGRKYLRVGEIEPMIGEIRKARLATSYGKIQGQNPLYAGPGGSISHLTAKVRIVAGLAY